MNRTEFPSWAQALPAYEILSGPYAGRTARGWARPYKGVVACWLTLDHPYSRPDGSLGSALMLTADQVGPVSPQAAADDLWGGFLPS